MKTRGIKIFFILELTIFIFHLKVNAENKAIDFLKQKTKIEDPLSIRDPFKEPRIIEKDNSDISKGIVKNGVFTNIETVEDIGLDDFVITGVVVGTERRAVAQLKNGGTVILKEGMTIGKDNAEIKAILPGGIVLVEKIVNVYGQDEYIETIIPVSKSGFNKRK